MKKITFILLGAALSLQACHKASSSTSTEDYTTLESEVLNDFVQKIALPQYNNLQLKAASFNTAVVQLNASPTDANLQAARQGWRDVRQGWEQCEGFLFGPVEDDNYDPQMDTWPVDNVQLDSLMASSNPLSLTDIQSLSTLSLRGFHPLEYILWGKNGNSTAASITAREKQYMISLSADIVNNTTNLNYSWLSSGSNFQNDVLNAGKGSTRFKSRQEVFLAIAGAMIDICGEVGDSKMGEPFAAYDSTITESRFSHNSIADFRNNIIGAQNVYLCTYGGASGKSLSALVAAKNISLDNQIKAQFTAAINSFNSVSTTFEQGIYTQRTQIQNCITALNTLSTTLDEQLLPFIKQYVKD